MLELKSVSYCDYCRPALRTTIFNPQQHIYKIPDERWWLGCPDHTAATELTDPLSTARQSSHLCQWRASWKVSCMRCPDSYSRHASSTNLAWEQSRETIRLTVKVESYFPWNARVCLRDHRKSLQKPTKRTKLVSSPTPLPPLKWTFFANQASFYHTYIYLCMRIRNMKPRVWFSTQPPPSQTHFVRFVGFCEL